MVAPYRCLRLPLRVLVLCARRLDEAEQPLRRDRKFVDLDAERRQRVGQRVGDRRRRADRAAFAHAAKAAERRRRRALEMHDVHRRNFAGRRHQIIDQARGMDLALLVVDDFFVERRADALRDAAVNLAVDDQRIDEFAAILGDGEMIDADFDRFPDRSRSRRYASPT